MPYIRTVEVRNALLAGAIGARKPNLSAARSIADERNLSIRRVCGILIAHSRGNESYGRFTAGSLYAIDVHILC